MKCPKCQHESSETKTFYCECGANLLLPCPKCEADIFPTDKFCDECGQNLYFSTGPSPKSLSFYENLDKIQEYLPKGPDPFVEKRLPGKRKNRMWRDRTLWPIITFS
jgi:hypothetical protein